jgi:hypothetical protein
MAGPNRDDFSAPVKREVAARSGNRCSNPTCRLLTNRPDPARTDKSLNLGVAAHICAASAGGPRYDATMSPEERKSPNNAIWLCQSCSRIIDSSPDAFTVDGLLAWKRHAEIAATRDSKVTGDYIGSLLVEIKALRLEIIRFVGYWQGNSPTNTPWWQGIDSSDRIAMKDAFDQFTLKAIQYSVQMQAEFRSELLPLLASACKAAEVILGADNSDVAALIEALRNPDTNYFSIRDCETALGRVQDTLALR